jgi:DNA recombination protein RmuC
MSIIIIPTIFAFIILVVSLVLFSILRSVKKKEKEMLAARLEALEKSFGQIAEITSKHFSDLKQDVLNHLQTNSRNLDTSTRAMHDRVKDFTESITRMHSALREVHGSVEKSAEKMASFHDIFKTPQLRGPWGESSLEYLLNQRYDRDLILHPYYFKSGEGVEFCLKLPNKLLLPIDSKFPMDSYVAYFEAEEKAKSGRLREFIARIKKEVDDIASKYIRPSEGTADFALMYIPAEAIYYEILFNNSDAKIGEYSQSKKVIITSPNTLYLTLRVIEHWFNDIKVSRRTRDIVKRLGDILIDGKKLSESFEKLGKHIENVQGAYEGSQKRLNILSGKVERVITLGEKEAKAQLKKELPKQED